MAVVINGSGTVTGLTAQASDIELTDSTELKFGTGDDLSIEHDGSHSYINEAGTGSLYVQSNGAGVIFQKHGSVERLCNMNTDGSVELFHDASKKFETSATGATVTGILTADSVVGAVTQQDPTILPYADLDSAAHHNVGNFTIDSRGRYRIFVDLRMGGSSQSGFTKVYLGTSSAGGMIGNPRLSIENMNVASWNIGLNFQWVMDFGTSLTYPYTVYVNVYNNSAGSSTLFHQSDANGYPVVSCLKVADIATATSMVAFGS